MRKMNWNCLNQNRRNPMIHLTNLKKTLNAFCAFFFLYFLIFLIIIWITLLFFSFLLLIDEGDWNDIVSRKT
jgi:hypothetical protein